MIEWITINFGTILISIILILIVGGITIKLYKDKKKGKSSCGCSCGDCPSANRCHNKEQG